MITNSRLGHAQLGNQMFQYAMLLGVSAKCGCEVQVPKHLNKPKKRGLYELDKFHVSRGELACMASHHYQEQGFEYDPLVFEQPDGTDYNGYYQTEKYFAHVEEEVRREFRFNSDIEHWAWNYLKHNRDHRRLVAIHVRRGDYLERPDLFQTLSATYYEVAKRQLRGQYMVFSDDLDWCSRNLAGKHTLVESPSHWHDLAIMSHCDAHIISASSFSWWGAWLSRSNLVIAPTPWFPLDGPRGSYNMSDVIPDRWMKHEVSSSVPVL